MPFSVWFRQQARSFLRDLLSPAAVKQRGLLDSAYVQKLLDQHETGAADHGPLLWGLLSLELWFRIFLDTPPHARRQPGSILAVHSG